MTERPSRFPPEGGGGTPLYKPYKGKVFAPFWSEKRYGFQGNCGSVRTYLSFQFQMSKKEKKYANSKWNLRNLFCCCSNLSNRKARSENGCKKMIFFGLK